MAQHARFQLTVLSSLGVAQSGASVEVRRQGATVNGNQSGTSPLTVTVNDPGAILTADTVAIGTGSTTFNVDSVTATTVVLSGFAGTLVLTDDDRITPVNSLPALFEDAQGVESKANPLTTSATGLATAWVEGNFYDALLSGAGLATQLIQDIYVFGSINSTNVFDAANIAKWRWDTERANDIFASGGGSNQSYHTEWLDNGSRVMTLGGLDTQAILRVGGRAQTAGPNEENFLVFASETYASDRSAEGETFALYGLNVLQGNIPAGAAAHIVTGELQFTPLAGKTATGVLIGVQGLCRYLGSAATTIAGTMHGGEFTGSYEATVATASAADVRGLSAGAHVLGASSAGTVTALRSLNAEAPTKAGAASVTEAVSLRVVAPAAGVGATINQVARFGGTDEAADFVVTGCPIRIDDSENTRNDAVGGRWIDVARSWTGTDLGSPQFNALNVFCKADGTFTAGDTLSGARVEAETGTVAGDGTNLATLRGFAANIKHRSNATVTNVFGTELAATMEGAGGTVTNLAGLNVALTASAGTVTNAYGAILRSLTPSASFASTGHIKMVPVSLATPATSLNALTAAENGTVIYLTDSDNAANSGFYFRVNGVWHGLTGARLGGAAWPGASGFTATDA